MATLHWQLRSHLHEFHPATRLIVLTTLILHANIRMRCWPGIDLICKETGYKTQAVSEAKKWLAERGAFVLVPYKQRVDEERALPSRQHVYQLTGILKFEGETVPYLFMTPESQQAIEAAVSNVLNIKTSMFRKSKVSKIKSFENQGTKLVPSLLSSSKELKGSASSDPEKETTAATSQKSNIYKLYEGNIGLLTPMICESLKDIETTYPSDWVETAFSQAVEHNKRNLAYIKAILKRMESGTSAPSPRKAQSAAAPTPIPVIELTEAEREQRAADAQAVRDSLFGGHDATSAASAL